MISRSDSCLLSLPTKRRMSSGHAPLLLSAAGMRRLPRTLFDESGQVFHINYGATLSDLK
jgi:hypothetical protein